MFPPEALTFGNPHSLAILPHKDRVETSLQSRFDPHGFLKSLFILSEGRISLHERWPRTDVLREFEGYVQV